jgi:hypothetical protein
MATKISLMEVAEEYGYNDIMEMLTDYSFDSVVPACCSEGCEVEPDGHCSHGNPSILIKAGLI